MAGFIFEADLPHQTSAVEAVADVFSNHDITPAQQPEQNNALVFPKAQIQLRDNIRAVQKRFGVESTLDIQNTKAPIFDISMETGTGKTYAYTKTIFELNKRYGLTKFIVAVPRVAIKANTVGFLKSEAAREHFKKDFSKQLKVYAVESQKKSKGKKEYMPQAIMEFCRADSRTDKNTIHVLVINAGMINSPTLAKAFDVALFDEFSIATEAIAFTKPVVIIDEPHLFKTDNKTFENLSKFMPQFTLRYGATFDGEFKNLLYQLSAVDAFNQDLVKGIAARIESFPEAVDTSLKLTGLDDEVTFELSINNKKTNFKLAKKESLAKIHPEMQHLLVEEFNKSKLVLSNGLELKKGDTINPFSYAETMQNKMLQAAIVRHFEIERELFVQSPRIKPLSLFFIDNIDSYRNKDGAMKLFFEATVKAHLTKLIAQETEQAYKAHLQAAFNEITRTHGGYFSKDNSDKDEAIEQETLEILHDKELLLDFNNPRRFIFSKWTLREGWDNPNIFQICKLRSSGSETSKLQEVGRGLRLPVNEFMSRDKSKSYELTYYVDFTEADFAKKLTDEINQKSGVGFDEERLNEALMEALLKHYSKQLGDTETLLEILDAQGIIKRSNDFKEGGLAKLKETYPLAFGGQLKVGKVTSGSKPAKHKATIRAGKYDELKTLWEAINQKMVLEYKLDNATNFEALFRKYLRSHVNGFTAVGSSSETHRLFVESNRMAFGTEISAETKVLPFKMMPYQAFLMQLSKDIALSIQMLHSIFKELLNEGVFDVNLYLSLPTIRKIKDGFNEYLMQQVFAEYSINYKKTSNSIHPTALTNFNGKALSEIDSAGIGGFSEELSAPANYLFNEVFYDDAEIELNNIRTDIAEVIVYSKIPKNSIRIPLVGGGTYSPDFAYVIKDLAGNATLNLIVESKNKTAIGLSSSEKKKIEHAEVFFSQLSSNIKVSFKSQLQSKTIASLIKDSLQAID